QQLVDEGKLLAYHDRSDGGLFVTLAEMAFAGRIGINVQLDCVAGDNTEVLAALFNEEAGAVIQVANEDVATVKAAYEAAGLAAAVHQVGTLNADDTLRLNLGGAVLFEASRLSLHQQWSATSMQMQMRRDKPECAQEEWESLPAADSVGLSGLALTYPLDENPAAGLAQDTAPAIAIQREQGHTGHTEVAAAFHAADCAPHDVHMSDLEAGRVSLNSFRDLALPGGSTFSDALGAGFAWAQKILNDSELRSAFEEFFQREDTFTLGVGNGAQVLSHLQALIPGAEHWPAFKRNRSDQFEARVALVEVVASPSIFLQGMEGSRLPVPVGHAEGRAVEVDASQV